MIRAELTLEIEGGGSILAYTVDVSSVSMGVLCKKFIEPGTTVMVHLAGEEMARPSEASVAHCTHAISGYRIGLVMS